MICKNIFLTKFNNKNTAPVKTPLKKTIAEHKISFFKESDLIKPFN